MEMYIYVIGVLFFVGTWSALFGLAPKSRMPILWSSLAWGPAGPISEYWHVKDYWNPHYLLKLEIGDWAFGVEDFLFAFMFGGLCAGMFDLLLRKSGHNDLTRFTAMGFMLLLCGVMACLVVMSSLVVLFNVNSLHSIVIAFLGGTIWILAWHPNWIPAALLTAATATVVMWIFYWGFLFRLFPSLVEQWWRSDALSGISIGGVPIEEVIWACAAGLFVGPLLRYCMDRTSRANLSGALSS